MTFHTLVTHTSVKIFGGRDTSGQYLSEVWLLRAYKGSIVSTDLQWEGFGNGRLSTGIGADGSGVTVQYLSQCATAISTSANITVSSEPPVPTSTHTTHPTTHPSAPSDPITRTYETSLLHKLFVPLSLIILQVIILIFRNPIRPPSTYYYLAGGLGAYGLGVAGFVLAFTTISVSPDIPSTILSHLHTVHGVAGLIFFLCVYALVPLLMLINASTSRLRGSSRKAFRGSHQTGGSDPGPVRSDIVVDEKPEHIIGSRSAPQSLSNISPPSSPRLRTQSWGPFEAGMCSDTESFTSGIPRGFEVVNRPPRLRQASGNTVPAEIPRSTSKSLGEVDWLLRRRSLNLVVRRIIYLKRRLRLTISVQSGRA